MQLLQKVEEVCGEHSPVLLHQPFTGAHSLGQPVVPGLEHTLQACKEQDELKVYEHGLRCLLLFSDYLI